MGHKKYLGLLLDEAATKFGIVCFLLAVFVSPFFGVDGKYLSAVTYLGALGSLYWSAYAVWVREVDTSVQETSKELNINPLASKVTFASGNGYTFTKANVRVDLGVTNDTNSGVSVSGINLIADTGSDKVVLENAIKIIDEENAKDLLKTINVNSGQSKVVSLRCVLQTTLKTSMETASYLNSNSQLIFTLNYKIVRSNTVQEKSILLNVSTEELVNYFSCEWSRNGERDALATIA